MNKHRHKSLLLKIFTTGIGTRLAFITLGKVVISTWPYLFISVNDGKTHRPVFYNYNSVNNFPSFCSSFPRNLLFYPASYETTFDRSLCSVEGVKCKLCSSSSSTWLVVYEYSFFQTWQVSCPAWHSS